MLVKAVKILKEGVNTATFLKRYCRLKEHDTELVKKQAMSDIDNSFSRFILG